MQNKFKRFQFRLVAFIVAMVVIFTASLSAVMLHRSRKAMLQNVATLLAANSRQLELNINHYLNKVEKTVALMFSDEAYYAFDATDPSLDDYTIIQSENVINDKIVDLGLMENFSDFGIVYADDSQVGWISQVTKSYFSDGGIYDAFAEVIQNENTLDGWAFGLCDNSDRLWYVKRMNPNALMVVSFYSGEIAGAFDDSEQLEGMVIRLADDEDTILYSTKSSEIGHKLPTAIESLSDKQNSTTVENNEYLVTTNLCSNGWRVICAEPTKDALREMNNLRAFVVAFTILIILAFLAMFLPLYNVMSKPVDSLVDNLNEKASEDQLSGLLNKITFESLAGSSLETSIAQMTDSMKHTSGYTESVAFIMIDIDDFKRINDTLGHERGDVAIVTMGKLLRMTFGTDFLVGRIGGDEFAAFSIRNNETCKEVIRQIEQKMQQLTDEMRRQFVDEEWGGLHITASIGIAVAKVQESKLDELYREADKSLYFSKNNGKNQYHITTISGEEKNR